MRTYQLTFVHAPEDYYDQNYGTQFIPLWAYCLAAHVSGPWQVSIVDCKHETLDRCGPADVFAFSGINQDVRSIRRAWEVLKARYPGALFILGGPITWSFEQDGKLDQLECFDHLFILDGEQTLPAFLEGVAAARTAPRIIRGERFPMDQSRPQRFDLFRPGYQSYYGGVIEVSRGCPFLCEFCDIRVLPGNNRANNKPVALIIDELDAYHRRGITRIQFACDNFIGDVVWARECVEAMVEWKERVGADLAVFTWLTINLYKHPDLMRMMRRAGFSVLFIGIESVNQSSLLETAKVQNLNVLDQAVRTISSYGFIIAPGFIFGFDSDTERVFDDTLAFLAEAGIIGGDPSFLMALPGTPLYERMQRTGRLVPSGQGVERRKIQTNIRYLLDAGFLTRGFIGFIRTYTSARFQYARFKRLLDIIASQGRYVPVKGPGYGSPLPYLRLQLRSRAYASMLWRRLWFIARRPANVWAVARAWLLVGRHQRAYPGLGAHFFYWVYAWTNIALKYQGLHEEQFLLHSVGRDFDLNTLAPLPRAGEAPKTRVSGDTKVDVQARFTNRALLRLVKERRNAAK